MPPLQTNHFRTGEMAQEVEELAAHALSFVLLCCVFLMMAIPDGGTMESQWSFDLHFFRD